MKLVYCNDSRLGVLRGDTVELETQGLGRLTVKLRDELKRTWARDTRSEREAKGLTGTTPQIAGKYAKADTVEVASR